ncbi:hypothetical protein GCM10023201_46510 [Actinomycetospora corticicola]|uniref:Uncharacterized protein n=1 Tax=Actinomycetospora corticicola TaxID=663602 RepID=A0A7Y9J8P7_9PSEU|nr:hypothetical protein [Actinomycetospora corticicola]NYD39640.1 hypothetical protein [Actinomycetospora corticicola]
MVRPAPDDATRPRADVQYRPEGGPTAGAPVGRPDDAWLLEDDEFRYAGRLDQPAPAEGAEVEADGRTWSVEGDASVIGEAGTVLEPEPNPTSDPDGRLGLTGP